MALIGDRVAPERRGLASGVFYAGVPLGFALAFALAGWLGPWLGWRACFLLLGPLGLLAVAFVWRMGDPPRRGGHAAAPAPGLSATAGALARAVRERPALAVVAAGGVLVVFASAASQHAITWLVQERGFEYRRAALLSSAMLLAGGLVGSLAIGALTDRARRRGVGARLVALGALGAAGLLASFAFYTLAPGSPLFLPCWFLAQCWLMGWYGPCVTALDEMAPAGLKATTVGASLLLINLLGVATGPYVAGLIGDHWGLTAGLRWSLLPSAAGALLFVLVGLGEGKPRPTTDVAASG
jgi:predicted MFS family arabinose efflux permease